MSTEEQWVSGRLRFSSRMLLCSQCCLPERKWMYHVSCLWTQISKRLPYLGTPHGSRDGEIVSFSSFPQPEQVDSEQYQISSFSQTFWTPKCPEIGRWKFLSPSFNSFLCWRLSLTIEKHLNLVGVFIKEEMWHETFNKRHIFWILI